MCFSVPAKPSLVHLRPCHHFVMHGHKTWWLERETWPCVHTVFKGRRLDITNRLAQQHVLLRNGVFAATSVCGSPAMIMRTFSAAVYISGCVLHTPLNLIMNFNFQLCGLACVTFFFSLAMTIHVYRRLLTISSSDVLCTKHSFKSVPVCHFITFANIETSKCGRARVYQVQGVANAHCFSPC